MTNKQNLPEQVLRFIEMSAIAEFATVSSAGVPIDTPGFCFPSDDLSTIDFATGLAYPAKAERARRNPKVGLLIESGPEEMVVSIRGRAAVRDADVGANAVRYLAEIGFENISLGLDWSKAREAVWYFMRIIIQVMPERIMWWDSRAAMDRPPHVWNAPAGTVFPLSDPTPTGRVSPSSEWPLKTWQEIAEEAIANQTVPHLTLCDDDGYPLPMRVQQYELVDGGFRLTMPRGVLWRYSGKATLSFCGHQTFVGDVSSEEGVTWLCVERALPQLPLNKGLREVLQPPPEVKAKLMARLEEETARRGQAFPVLPMKVPAPTRIALLRRAKQTAGKP